MSNKVFLPDIQKTGLDYATIVQAVKDYIQNHPNYSANWSQMTDGDAGKMLVDVFAWITENLGSRIDIIANELFTETAKLDTSKMRLLKLLGNSIDWAISAEVPVDISISVALSAGVDGFILSPAIDSTSFSPFSITGRKTDGQTGNFECLKYDTEKEKFDYLSEVALNYVNSSNTKITALEDVLFYEGTTTVNTVTVGSEDGFEYKLENLVYDSRSASVFLVVGQTLTELLRVDSFSSTESQVLTNLDGEALPITYKLVNNFDRSISVVFPTLAEVPLQDKRLHSGDVLKIVIRTCSGEKGNISVASISKNVSIYVDANNSPEMTLINNKSGYGGKEKETLDEAIERAPAKLYTGDRVINSKDANRILYDYYGVLKNRSYGYRDLAKKDVYVNPQEMWNYVLLKKPGWTTVKPSNYNSFAWFTFLLENRLNDIYSFKDGTINQSITTAATSIETTVTTEYDDIATSKTFYNTYTIETDDALKAALASSEFTDGNVRIKVSESASSNNLFDTIATLTTGEGSFSAKTVATQLNKVFATLDPNVSVYTEKTSAKEYLYIVDSTGSGISITDQPFLPAGRSLFSYSSPAQSGLLSTTSPTTISAKAVGPGSIDLLSGLADWTTTNFPVNTYYFKIKIDEATAVTKSWTHIAGNNSIAGVVSELNAITGMSTLAVFSVVGSTIRCTAVGNKNVYIYPETSSLGTLSSSFFYVAKLGKTNIVMSEAVLPGLRFDADFDQSKTSGTFIFKMSRNGVKLNSGANISVFIPETSAEDVEKEINYTTQSITSDIQATTITEDIDVSKLTSIPSPSIRLNIDERGWVTVNLASHKSAVATIADRINSIVVASPLYNGTTQYALNNCPYGNSYDNVVSIWPGKAWPYDRCFIANKVGYADCAGTTAISTTIPLFPISGTYKFRATINESLTKTYAIVLFSGMTWDDLAASVNKEIDKDFLFMEKMELVTDLAATTGTFDLIIRSKNYDKVQTVEVVDCSGACGSSLLGSLGFLTRDDSYPPVTSYGDYSSVATAISNKLLFSSACSGSTSSVVLSTESEQSMVSTFFATRIGDDTITSYSSYGTRSIYLNTKTGSADIYNLFVENGSCIFPNIEKTEYIHYLVDNKTSIDLGTYSSDTFAKTDAEYKPYAKRLYNTVTTGTLGTIDWDLSSFELKISPLETAASDYSLVSNSSGAVKATGKPFVRGRKTFTSASNIAGTYSVRFSVDGLTEIVISSLSVSGANFQTQLGVIKTAINTAAQTALSSLGTRYASFAYFDFIIDGNNIYPSLSSPTLNESLLTGGTSIVGSPRINIRKVSGDVTSIVEMLFDQDFSVTNWNYTFYPEGDYYFYYNSVKDVMAINKIPGSVVPDSKFFAHYIDDRRAYDYNGITNYVLDEDIFTNYLDSKSMMSTSNLFKKVGFKTFDVKMSVYYDKRYVKETVQARVIATLYDKYGVSNGEIGESVNKNKLISTLHSVDGVDFVIIEKFGELMRDASNLVGEITCDYNQMIVLHETELDANNVVVRGLDIKCLKSETFSK